MMEKKLDLSDVDVRMMAIRHHTPEEQWIISGEGGILTGVFCDECHNTWPCPTVIELRNLIPRPRNG